MSEFITYFVGCICLEVFCGILIPEGKIKSFVLSSVSIIVFYYVVSYITQYLSYL